MSTSKRLYIVQHPESSLMVIDLQEDSVIVYTSDTLPEWVIPSLGQACMFDRETQPAEYEVVAQLIKTFDFVKGTLSE
jgi:hypothetical protein